MNAPPAIETAETAPARAESRNVAIDAAAFARDVLALDDPDCLPVVWTLDDKATRRAPVGQDFGAWVNGFDGRSDTYVSMATFPRGARRTAEHAGRLKSLFFDLDCEPGKAGKYESKEDAIRAFVGFLKKTGLRATHLVRSGRGVHAYFALATSIDAATYVDLSSRLAALARREGLLFDPAVMANAAQVMRIPGTINSKNGATCTATRLHAHDFYSVDAIAALLPSVAPDAGPPAATGRAFDASVKAEVIAGDSRPSDPQTVIAECPAMGEVARTRGDVPEPFWRAMLGLAKHTTGGADMAHQLSEGYAGYDFAETQRKIDGWKTGPTTCTEFGKHTKACETCPHSGKIKSPIVLGYSAPAAPAARDGGIGEAVDAATEDAKKVYKRYAEVRVGMGVVVLDRQTPVVTAMGVVTRPDYLTVAAFRQALRGRWAPTLKKADKPRPLADAFLSDPERPRFEGTVFAPGEVVPANVLNLYQGYAVEPRHGNVRPWLRVLGAVAPNRATRRYILRWLAWKVQNPGAVPGTILLVTGSKGAGKNALFEPIVRIFGAHGAVFDDSEQIAGRFTLHLMTLAFVVLDEALFTGDPKQADRIKSRVTATSMSYEGKGLTPIPGVNRGAYVSLTNHTHVWQADTYERRAVISEAGNSLIGNRPFWNAYYRWLATGGPSALLHMLQCVNLSGFDPRDIPKGAALRRQIAHTTLRDPAASWWHTVLSEGAVTARSGAQTYLESAAATEVDKTHLRESFEGSGARRPGDWDAAMRKLRAWAGASGISERRGRAGNGRVRMLVLPPLDDMRAAFTAATGVEVDGQ